jgi:hypothetical protein
MVESLRKLIQELEAPNCPTCTKSMTWSWSQLVRYSPFTIEHEFICADCGGTQKFKQVRHDEHTAMSGKLSLPRSSRRRSRNNRKNTDVWSRAAC